MSRVTCQCGDVAAIQRIVKSEFCCQVSRVTCQCGDVAAIQRSVKSAFCCHVSRVTCPCVDVAAIQRSVKSEVTCQCGDVAAIQRSVKSAFCCHVSRVTCPCVDVAAIQRSVKSELDRQSSLRCETEGRLRETEATLKSIQAKSKQLIHALQNQLEQQTTARVRRASGCLRIHRARFSFVCVFFFI